MYSFSSFSIIIPEEDGSLMSCTILSQLKYDGNFLKIYLHLENCGCNAHAYSFVVLEL